MSHLGKLVAAHPLRGSPYDKLEFVKFNQHGIPVYQVECGRGQPKSAFNALQEAFEIHGGKCFYCPKTFDPQSLSNTAAAPHRDHVVAASEGGRDYLHNLVIACGACGHTKAAKPIHQFQLDSARRYLEALNRHLTSCLESERKREDLKISSTSRSTGKID